MTFQVGDQVVHSVYGIGEIIQLDEKKLAGQTAEYYVVLIRDLTLWVPVHSAGESTLRYPTPASDFDNLLAILSSPAEPLADDRMERRTHLIEQTKDGKLASVCKAVRDLTYHRRTKKMNDNDNSTLERLQNLLLTEWAVALSIPVANAKHELTLILGEDVSKVKEPFSHNKVPHWQQSTPAP